MCDSKGHKESSCVLERVPNLRLPLGSASFKSSLTWGPFKKGLHTHLVYSLMASSIFTFLKAGTVYSNVVWILHLATKWVPPPQRKRREQILNRISYLYHLLYFQMLILHKEGWYQKQKNALRGFPCPTSGVHGITGQSPWFWKLFASGLVSRT